MPAAGYLYVLVNSSLPGVVKIGRTTRDPRERAGELSASSGVVASFVVAYHLATSDCERFERLVHHQLAAYRCRQEREFFQVCATDAIHIIQAVSREFDEPERPQISGVLPVVASSGRKRITSGQRARLAPVVARLRTINAQLERWATYIRDEQTLWDHSDGERVDLAWEDLRRAARTASIASLDAHDHILRVEEPLREVRWRCQNIKDRSDPYSYSFPWEVTREYLLGLADQLHGWIEEVLPHTNRAYELVVAQVPELLTEPK